MRKICTAIFSGNIIYHSVYLCLFNVVFSCHIHIFIDTVDATESLLRALLWEKTYDFNTITTLKWIIISLLTFSVECMSLILNINRYMLMQRWGKSNITNSVQIVQTTANHSAEYINWWSDFQRRWLHQFGDYLCRIGNLQLVGTIGYFDMWPKGSYVHRFAYLLVRQHISILCIQSDCRF